MPLWASALVLLACGGESKPGGDSESATTSSSSNSSGAGTSGGGAPPPSSSAVSNGSGGSGVASSGGSDPGSNSSDGTGGVGTSTGSNAGTGGVRTTASAGASGDSPSKASSTDGSDGSSNAGCPLQFGFDEDLESWDVIYSAADSGVDLVALDDIELIWNEDGGDSGAALEVDIAYDAGGQYVGVGIDLTTNPVDLSGLVLTAQVALSSGVGDAADLVSNPAGARIYAKSGDAYVYAQGALGAVTSHGQWYTVEFDLAYPDYVDTANGAFEPSDIREVGIQIDTSATSSSAQPGVVLIDSLGC